MAMVHPSKASGRAGSARAPHHEAEGSNRHAEIPSLIRGFAEPGNFSCLANAAWLQQRRNLKPLFPDCIFNGEAHPAMHFCLIACISINRHFGNLGLFFSCCLQE